jgi:hypothetical protein
MRACVLLIPPRPKESIMNLATHLLVSNGAQLAGIWLVLIALAVASLIALNTDRHLGAAALVGRLADSLGDHLERRRDERIRRAEQAADAARYAWEITLVARQAKVTGQRRREQWQDAQEQLDADWAAYQAAEERVTGALRGAAFDSYRVAYLPVHFAARERHLHTAATEAHRRGDLTGAQLVDALAHRNGWNPCLHPADQDVVLARAARANRQRAYQWAVATERAAWHETEVAVVAARTLRTEAILAAEATTRYAPAVRRRAARLSAAIPAT